MFLVLSLRKTIFNNDKPHKNIPRQAHILKNKKKKKKKFHAFFTLDFSHNLSQNIVNRVMWQKGSYKYGVCNINKNESKKFENKKQFFFAAKQAFAAPELQLFKVHIGYENGSCWFFNSAKVT